MSDNQGKRNGEGKVETHNQRSRENSGGSSDSKGTGQSQSNQVRENVKDSVSKTLGKLTAKPGILTMPGEC